MKENDIRKTPSFDQLFKIAGAADNLERWLGLHSGSTADWPIDLLCRDQESATTLENLLQSLQDTLIPFRAMSHDPDCDIDQKVARGIHHPCNCYNRE